MELYAKGNTTVTISEDGHTVARQDGTDYPCHYPDLLTFSDGNSYLVTSPKDLGDLLIEQGYVYLSLELESQ